MQFKIQTQNNKGVVLEDHVTEEGSMVGLLAFVKYIWDRHPTGVFCSIQVARPDPEVVAVKTEMERVLNSAFLQGASLGTAVDMLFDAMDIKPREKKNDARS